MMRQFLIFSTLLLLPAPPLAAQSFLGNTSALHSPVAGVSTNPALVAHAGDSPEIILGGFSVLGGTNAYRFSKSWVEKGLPSGPQEGEQYNTNLVGRRKRHMWGNFDVLGPGVAFHIKDNLYGGVYTRTREIVRGGNVSVDALSYLGSGKDAPYGKAATFNKAGFTAHSFAEFGFTLGKVLRDDYYHIVRVGATVKFLTGMAAGSLYIPEARVKRSVSNRIDTLTGSMVLQYTGNSGPFADGDISNDPGQFFDREGGRSLGFDVGVQYEFHPDGTPNATTPYTLSLGASLTDVGVLRYKADTGNGTYRFQTTNKLWWQYERKPYEPTVEYLGRMSKDGLLKKTETADHFNVGLPTALRLFADYNSHSNIYVSGNLVLNLKGSTQKIFRPGYVSMLNITPRYETKHLMVGLPFTMIGYGSILVGLNLRVGPVFLGSGSLFSTLLLNEVRNLDGYVGASFSLWKRKILY